MIIPTYFPSDTSTIRNPHSIISTNRWISTRLRNSHIIDQSQRKKGGEGRRRDGFGRKKESLRSSSKRRSAAITSIIVIISFSYVAVKLVGNILIPCAKIYFSPIDNSFELTESILNKEPGQVIKIGKCKSKKARLEKEQDEDRIIPRIIHRMWKSDNTEAMPKHWNRAYKSFELPLIKNIILSNRIIFLVVS
mmetsp:Transcript_11099/g.16787  ORF Transcript_11099/g.16787 Transcript_11099/m.16787 type:complete len:193 (+) Transcript_11099:54-632(+)